MDYSKYHELEKYLFDEVGLSYRKNGRLTVQDFFCIIIWKSNRSKSTIKKKIIRDSGSLKKGVNQIAKGISEGETDLQKLRFLVIERKFYLPIASSILAVLYPQRFTIYDYRVCSQLNKYHDLSYKRSEKAVTGYFLYKKDVVDKVSVKKKLREKDKFLWGKSFYVDLKKMLKC
jgi:hypothetical protein